MSAEKKPGLIRRNTAITMRDNVQQPCIGMMDETVPEGTYLFGFDASDVRNEGIVFAVDSGATREPNQHYQAPFMLYTWAVKRITLAEDDKTAGGAHARLILVDNEGETLAFVSQGALGSLDLIRALRGDGPYDPAIPICVSEEKTRHGFRVFKLRIVAATGAAPKVK